MFGKTSCFWPDSFFVICGQRPKISIKTCSWTKNQVALVTVFLNIHVPVCHSPVLPCLLYLGKTWYDLLGSHSDFLHGTRIGLWSIYTTCAGAHDNLYLYQVQWCTVDSLVKDKVLTSLCNQMWTILKTNYSLHIILCT